MSSRDSWTIGRIAGVPVRIHFTWILIAVYLWVVFARQFAGLAAAAEVNDANVLWPPWLWGVLLTVGLFACVLGHELAHVLVAQRSGAKVRSITLMMLGGVSEMSELESPRAELATAVVGPAASVLLGAIFYGLFRLTTDATPDLRFGLFYLAEVNFVIGLFNLLPAFPMDGGRALRSVLTRSFGRVRATQIAATVGKVIAAGLVVLGLLGGSWWLALIGLFVFLGGEAESRALQARAALRGLRVGDFFSRRLVGVEAGATVADAAAAMLEARSPLAVVTSNGRPIGLVTAGEVARVPVRERGARLVAAELAPVQMVSFDDELPAVLRRLDEERLEAVVVEQHGQLVGTLSREDIARALQLRELAAARV
ncbi:MAG TPA: site-2 protease family protein [Polyangia bacterium]|nr:site-2 protease family protein [Polyangia bacterium]